MNYPPRPSAFRISASTLIMLTQSFSGIIRDPNIACVMREAHYNIDVVCHKEGFSAQGGLASGEEP